MFDRSWLNFLFVNSLKLHYVVLDEIFHDQNRRVIDVFCDLNAFVAINTIFQQIEIVKYVENWKNKWVLNDICFNFDLKKFMIF